MLDREKLHQESFENATAYMESCIDNVISEEDLLSVNESLTRLAERDT